MKKEYRLHVKLLRFLLDSKNPFNSVKLDKFLLENFDTNDVKVYMNNIRNFVHGLEKSNLIEITDSHDLRITNAQTRVQDFYIYAKITVDGIQHISDQNLKALNKASIYTSVIIGISVAITSILTLVISLINN